MSRRVKDPVLHSSEVGGGVRAEVDKEGRSHHCSRMVWTSCDLLGDILGLMRRALVAWTDCLGVVMGARSQSFNTRLSDCLVETPISGKTS